MRCNAKATVCEDEEREQKLEKWTRATTNEGWDRGMGRVAGAERRRGEASRSLRVRGRSRAALLEGRAVR